MDQLKAHEKPTIFAESFWKYRNPPKLDPDKKKKTPSTFLETSPLLLESLEPPIKMSNPSNQIESQKEVKSLQRMKAFSDEILSDEPFMSPESDTFSNFPDIGSTETAIILPKLKPKMTNVVHLNFEQIDEIKLKSVEIVKGQLKITLTYLEDEIFMDSIFEKNPELCFYIMNYLFKNKRYSIHTRSGWNR